MKVKNLYLLIYKENWKLGKLSAKKEWKSQPYVIFNDFLLSFYLLEDGFQMRHGRLILKSSNYPTSWNNWFFNAHNNIWHNLTTNQTQNKNSSMAKYI